MTTTVAAARSLNFSTFGLLWFLTTVDRASEMVSAGVDAVVVDWEQKGKQIRQAHRDTQINKHSVRDLQTLRDAVVCPIVCRINAVGDHSAIEVESAIGAGADDLLVPMLRSRDELDHVIDLAAGRVRVAAMIETADAVRGIDALVEAPIAWLYVGLHDLWIDVGSRHPFVAIADGTVDRVLEAARQRDVPAGFGGLTRPEMGRPLPVRHLVDELARLGAALTFLRRSFERDSAGAAAAAGDLAAIRSAVTVAARRPAAQMEADRAAAWAACAELPDPPWRL